MKTTNYLYRGRTLFVDEVGKFGFRTFFVGLCGDRHTINVGELPLRPTRLEAQIDLNRFAYIRKLKEAA